MLVIDERSGYLWVG